MGRGGTPPLTAVLPPPMLHLLPTSPYLPQSPHPVLAPRLPLSSRPGPLPISSSLLSWPSSSGSRVRLSLGRGSGGSLSSPLSSPSPFSLPPPASTPRSSPAHSPSPSPAAPPSFSPTSLFQLRTGSSGQFPHCRASGEETAPLR